MPEEVNRDAPVIVTPPPPPPVIVPRRIEPVNRTAWGAIWCGVVIALGMEALFTLFGFFIGLELYSTHVNAAGAAGNSTSIWTTIWYLVTVGWSMFFGAWCASRLSGIWESGALHGIATWGLATFATILVVGITVWAVFREGILLLATGVVTPLGVMVGPGGGAIAVAPQNTAGVIANVAGRLWGGVMLGLITAILGGLAGRSRVRALGETQQVPGTRLAA